MIRISLVKPLALDSPQGWGNSPSLYTDLSKDGVAPVLAFIPQAPARIPQGPTAHAPTNVTSGLKLQSSPTPLLSWGLDISILFSSARHLIII